MKTKVKPVQEKTAYIPDYDAKVSELAYHKAKNRRFEPGHEWEDWFAAEQELQCCGQFDKINPKLINHLSTSGDGHEH